MNVQLDLRMEKPEFLAWVQVHEGSPSIWPAVIPGLAMFGLGESDANLLAASPLHTGWEHLFFLEDRPIIPTFIIIDTLAAGADRGTVSGSLVTSRAL